MQNISREYYNTYQLKLPLEISTIIDISDPVYSFNEVMNHIDLKKYLVRERNGRTGRPEYDPIKLLRIILFAFMEYGYVSVRQIEKLCKTDIRFMWLLDGSSAPSFMTINNFMNTKLASSIENIFCDINSYIFSEAGVDINHVYIDGTKIIANANRYSWVWKKSCLKNRLKTFEKLNVLLEEMNNIIAIHGVKFGKREEYAIEYLEEIQSEFVSLTGYEPTAGVSGRGHHKSKEQRLYETLVEYTEKLKKYAERLRICGEDRNSYSKTDHGATFMRMKRDYMGNDQLLPGYNLQLGVCDEFIAVYDINHYASDMDCFKPLMEKFNSQYGKYPEYPVADAGYGSFDNYLYCEEHGMKKFMKFTMYKKETDDKKYREDPYRAVNFPINDNGCPVCPGGKEFHYLKSIPIKNNHYGRTEELWQCEDCTDCPLKPKCCKCQGNRVVRLNEELTVIHKEVLDNLNSIHGALLRMNRSIQAEGAFGTIKWNRSYTRARRRGSDRLLLEISMISCGFNLHKYHLRKLKACKAA